MRAWAHFKTITHHRRLVRKYCFRLGLYRQGLTHDLSKYSPCEFLRGVKYQQGYRHLLEYGMYYCIVENGKVFIGGGKRPLIYVAEMFCDRIAACKTYQGKQYTDASPYDYYERSLGHILIHPETAELIGKMLLVLKEEGEDAAFAYVRALLAAEKR